MLENSLLLKQIDFFPHLTLDTSGHSSPAFTYNTHNPCILNISYDY